MTKILSNKTFRAFVAIAMAVLLAWTLIPHIQPAYGNDAEVEVVATEEDLVDVFDEVVEELPENVDDVEGDFPDDAEEEGVDENQTEFGDEVEESADGEESNEEDDGIALLSDEDEAIDAQEISRDKTNVDNLEVKSGETSIASLKYTDGKTYSLTVNGTLKGTIYVTGGTTLNLEGSGTINGNGAATVIHVEGGNSTLNVCKNSSGVTITGGKGGTKLNDTKNFPDYYGGGGILVQRKGVASDGTGGTGASLNLYNGKIIGNKAGAGGGIYIDRDCSFYMANGEVSGNYAMAINDQVAHEAGGIYVAGSSAKGGSYTSGEHAYIAAGTIKNNHTQTTIDWGGGGIFVESKGVLKIGTARITQNTAQGLGGGVSGCPHASIGVGDIKDGAAIWNNTAYKNTKPNNSFLTISQWQDDHRYGDMYAYGLSTTDFKDGELTSDGDKRSGISNDTGISKFIGKDYSKHSFTADYAQDYYCTKVSAIMGPKVSISLAGDNVWKGYTANENGGSSFTIKKGETRAFTTGAVGLTSLLPASFDPGNRNLIIESNTSSTHGGGIGCNGKLIMGDLPSDESFAALSLEFEKSLLNTLGEQLNLGDYRFDFELTDTSSAKVYAASTDGAGMVQFNIPGEDYLADMVDGQQKTVSFELREIVNRSYPDVVFDSEIHKVSLTFKAEVGEAEIVAGANVTSYAFKDVSVTVDGKNLADFSVTNTVRLSGAWTPEARKFLHGAEGSAGAYELELVEVEEPQGGIADLKVKDGGETRSATNGAFTEADGSASVVFDDIFYTEAGTHWYRIRETNGSDPVVYVVKVVVAGNNDGVDGVASTSLMASATEIFYGDSMDADTLTLLEVVDDGNLPIVEFHNNSDAYALSGYAVSALSGAPLTQKCLVDPKIVKVLEGRSLTPGEFSFQLIEVAEYSDTTGEVISETTNDADGMVDFDAAANKADEGWEPSCLLFTQPGTYKYRVIEDPSQLADPSVDYSTQVITFTVVVELDAETGVLAATDMYYGYLDEAGENVRYKEQYTGWQERDSDWVPSAADYANYDATWHPTITNSAKPMDLAVQKSSAFSGEALEGATYALYLVNHGGEADIRLANAVSDVDGWMYFEDVTLKVGNLYYFIEEAAPAGHTVDKFRSKYFYLVPDASSGNGYSLRYTDNKFVLEEANDEIVAAQDGAFEAETLDAEFGGSEVDTVDRSEPVLGKDGALLFVYEADGGVQDEATYVEFNKLDTTSREWVEGAKLSIVEKDTGKVVTAWESGKATEVLQQVLNVGTTYVLREDESPDGYEKAHDVEFVIGSFGEVEILSGTENGNAELSGSTITLYDTRIAVEEVVTETRETVREVPQDETKNRYLELAQTGDVLPLLAMGAIVLGALAVLLMARRRSSKARRSLR